MSNKNLSILKLCILFCIIQSFASTLMAANYYVSTSGNNSNNGSSSSPWRTIQYAVDQANGGDTIYVYGGTYEEQIIFSGSSDSGSIGSLLTLTAVNGQTPIIDGTNLTPQDRAGLITINGSSYIKIYGFTIRNFIANSSSGATPCGFYMDGTCTQVEFSSNTISNIKHQSTCTDPCGVGAHGIGVFGTTTGGITNVVFDSNEVYGNILQASEAFVINGNVDGFTQTNNYVHDNNNIGFDYIGYEGECGNCGDNDRARNGIVRGNRAINNRSDLANPWYAGDASAGGFYVDGGKDILFENNITSGNNMGFEVASEHDNGNTENIIVRNNYIYTNTEVGISIGGSVSSAPATNVSVINNTFYKNHGWGSEIVFQSYVYNSSIQNNIFYADNTNAYENHGSGHSGNTWSNNLYYNGTAGPGSVSTANPQLNAPANGDLDLTSSSPAIGIGTNSATNIGTTDIKGHARIYNGTVDLGAHEYGSGGTTPNSLTVSSLNPFSANGGSQTVTVTSNIDWTVSESSSWISVNITSGSNNGSVSVTVSENTSSNSRSATITIAGSGISRLVNVSQAGAGNNTPCTAGTNLSLNGTIAGFSAEQNTTNTVGNIIDGNDTNRWSAYGFPQYAVIDLGDHYNVNEVNLATYKNRDYQFTVEGSTTSATSGFSTLVDATNNTSAGTINKTFSTQNARYVKLTITGANSYTGRWSSIADFKIICANTTSAKTDPKKIVSNSTVLKTKASPNPFFNTIKIATETNDTIILKLVDLAGKTVKEKTINSNSSINNLGNLAKGLYFLQIINTNTQTIKIQKFIKN